MGRPTGNDRSGAYWRNGREHASGYQNNVDARANWEQGYREETVEVNPGPHRAEAHGEYSDDERHIDGSYAPAPPPTQTREGAGMQRGSWRGQGFGAEVYRGGIGTGNYESPYMPSRNGYGGQPRSMPHTEMRGPHTGKGPKGYQRSDERIREDVCERLTDHHDVDASDIEVSVESGEVTLTGTVSARRDKLMAEHAAEAVSGVIDIHNQIRVRREGAEPVRSAPPASKRDTTKS